MRRNTGELFVGHFRYRQLSDIHNISLRGAVLLCMFESGKRSCTVGRGACEYKFGIQKLQQR